MQMSDCAALGQNLSVAAAKVQRRRAAVNLTLEVVWKAEQV